MIKRIQPLSSIGEQVGDGRLEDTKEESVDEDVRVVLVGDHREHRHSTENAGCPENLSGGKPTDEVGKGSLGDHVTDLEGGEGDTDRKAVWPCKVIVRHTTWSRREGEGSRQESGDSRRMMAD